MSAKSGHALTITLVVIGSIQVLVMGSHYILQAKYKQARHLVSGLKAQYLAKSALVWARNTPSNLFPVPIPQTNPEHWIFNNLHLATPIASPTVGTLYMLKTQDNRLIGIGILSPDYRAISGL